MYCGKCNFKCECYCFFNVIIVGCNSDIRFLGSSIWVVDCYSIGILIVSCGN